MIAYFLGGFGAGIIIGIAFMWWTNIRHRRTPSLTKYVVFSLVMIILYTIVAIVYQWVKGQELSPTLTTCYYACFAGEILSSSLIKIFKLKEENKNE